MERDCLTAISSFVLLGSVRTKLLLSYFKSAKEIWNLSLSDLTKVGVSKSLAEKFVTYRNNFNLKDFKKRNEKAGIEIVHFSDKKYPENLQGLDDSPVTIYVKGKLLKKDNNSLAIIGSRNNSMYGKNMAGMFSYELAKKGITIISGLARGIDTEAHEGALSAKGRTIAVLGSGLDTLYPPENKTLAGQIVKNGALVSEYPITYPIYPNNFVERNRIVSGLSKAILVIEGAEKSGTLTTASFAANQGKVAFALPGRVDSPLSFVPHLLIKNGAKMACSPNDILEELN
jgi:DNA processing protein